MRRPKQALSVATLSFFVACNAILGNEDHYTLVPPDGGAGAAGDSSSGGDGGGGTEIGGAGGAPTSGGDAGSGTSAGGGGAPGGGDGGSAGAAGTAGAGGAACVPRGAEDCFNGEDDDCNDLTDCADAACTGPAMCVPAPSGATVGTFGGPGGACPSGYSLLTLRRGLNAPATCVGCGCTPDVPRCESGIYGHGTYPCPSYQFSGLLYNVYNTSCEAFSGDTSVHFYAVRGFTTCTATGTATPPLATWDENRDFCEPERVGAGCASGSVCVPKLSTPRCAMTPGTASCSGNYPTTTGDTWFAGLDDDRLCPACSCSFGSATCAGAKIQVYASGDCSGTPVDLDSGAEGDVCAVPIVPRSAKVLGTPTNASCLPNTTPTGSATAADPRTVCCQ